MCRCPQGCQGRISNITKTAGFPAVFSHGKEIYEAIATESRIRWAGLQPEDFELYTTYEDTYHCKPNPAYFQDILDKLALSAEECLMAGNDATEDMAAAKLGIHVFLLPKYLINRRNLDISVYPQGDFDDLLRYIDSLQKTD